MGRVLAGATAVSASLLLAGCSTVLLMTVAGPLDAPVLTPERRAGPVCLSELTIRRAGAPQASDDNVVWKIKGRDEECIGFDRLVYGQVPAGFNELAVTRPLEEGVIYTAMARGDIQGPLGALWAGGGAYFFEQGRWRLAANEAP